MLILVFLRFVKDISILTRYFPFIGGIYFYFSLLRLSILISWTWLQKVESRVRILSDLRELASAESLDTFTLIYTNILEHQPDCPVNIKKQYSAVFSSKSLSCKNLSKVVWFSLLQPEVVEKLVALREGIPRKDAKEVWANLALRFPFFLFLYMSKSNYLAKEELIKLKSCIFLEV